MNEEFRKTAPAPLAPIPFRIPAPFETSLANGLKIIIFEDKRFPLVSFRLAFRIGKIYEAENQTGLSSAVASMLNEGTLNYTSKELAEKIERLGASIGASSGSDNSMVSASVLSFYSAEIIDLMAEMILKPTFPESELNLYKENLIEGLKFQRSQASFLVDEQVSRIIFGEHPYHKTSPKIKDVENISREKLISLHKRNYIPNIATLIIVGDVERKSLLKQIEEKFGGWQKGSFEEKQFPSLPERSKRTLTIVDRKGSAQANIVLANPAINRTHPDYFAVLMMNQILGAGASSRLFMNLREEKSYTYGAYSSFDMRRLAGAFEASSEVRTAVTGESLHEFFYELDRIQDETVSEDELQDAKNYLTGVFPLRAETQEGLTNLLVSQQLNDLPEDYLQTYRDNVNAVTNEDVNRVANKYVMPEKLAIVIVGDAEEVLPQVREYAENIEIFDTEGNLQDISNYGKIMEEPKINISGAWELTLNFQGQKIPVKLKAEQTETTFAGTLETMFGNGKIENGKVSGNEFSGTAVTEMQGQSLELGIAGTIENDTIEGAIDAPMLPIPLEFTGKKIS